MKINKYLSLKVKSIKICNEKDPMASMKEKREI